MRRSVTGRSVPTRHRGLLLGRLFLLALLGLVAGAGGTAAQATPGPTTATGILELASRRLAETETVRFDLAIEGETFVDAEGQIQLLEANGDLERPDRVRATFKARALQAAIVTIELITIGDRSWTTDILTGQWGTAPVEFTYQPTILFDNQQGIGPVMSRVEDPELLGEEEIGDRPTYHVRAVVDEDVIKPLTANTLVGSPVTVDLWIDREVGDLVRARLAAAPVEGGPEPATWTLDLSDYGEEVTIESPV